MAKWFIYSLLAPLLVTLTCLNALAAPTAQVKKTIQGAKQLTKPGNDLSGPYNDYLGRLRKRVLSTWDFPPGHFHVVLQAEVNADGSVSHTTISSSPAGQAAERSASAAFSQAQPLESLPAGSASKVRIIINFDSTYDPHGDSNSSLSARLEPSKQDASPPSGQASPAVGNDTHADESAKSSQGTNSGENSSGGDNDGADSKSP